MSKVTTMRYELFQPDKDGVPCESICGGKKKK
nr:MAG TPA: Choline binding protein [Caudoviricetes sp.]